MNKCEELEKEAEECIHNILFWLNLPINKENIEKGGSYILKLLEPKINDLAKAKEIIRKYYKYNPSCEYSYEDIDKEAEQFLKESE